MSRYLPAVLGRSRRSSWRRGSIVVVAAILLLPVTVFLMSSINVGQLTNERRQVQDAADSLAHMHAVWTARSLNTISMNNTEAAQLLAVAIGSEALDESLLALEMQSNIAMGFIVLHSAVCPGFFKWWRVAHCFYQHYVTYMRPARSARSFVASVRSQFAPDHGIRTAHSGLEAINSMNTEIVRRFPAVIAEMTADYIRTLNLSSAHFNEACAGQGACPDASVPARGMSLPVIQGGQTARQLVCRVMQFGTLEALGRSLPGAARPIRG
jgi:hypothetical protein